MAKFCGTFRSHRKLVAKVSLTVCSAAGISPEGSVRPLSATLDNSFGDILTNCVTFAGGRPKNSVGWDCNNDFHTLAFLLGVASWPFTCRFSYDMVCKGIQLPLPLLLIINGLPIFLFIPFTCTYFKGALHLLFHPHRCIKNRFWIRRVINIIICNYLVHSNGTIRLLCSICVGAIIIFQFSDKLDFLFVLLHSGPELLPCR